ncbi:putative cruciform DNA binding protein, partial [Syncephalis plumigaleata]
NEPGRVHGNMEAAKGSVKQNVGHAVGNRTMEAHGEEQYSAGQAENRAAKNMNQAKGMGEQTTGATKQYTGQALGNERMQAEG